MINSIRYKFNSIISGLQNLWRWRKIIYYDRNWDYWFIYEMLKKKLEFQAEFILKYGVHATAEYDAEQIKKCIELIDIVQNEKIIDEALRADKWSKEIFEDTQRRHEQAKRELFKMLEDNIEHWWD